MQISEAMMPALPVLIVQASSQCRYKTGRCPNARAVKANGTLLLLCEYHRNQQNRTKKRSDMKCRHDRAKKRQAQRATFQKKQLPADHDHMALCWSPITAPLARITVPVDEYSAYSSYSVGSPSSEDEQDKTLESTSPTGVDIAISTVNWAPDCLSPINTPKMCLQETSFAPEDIWLLEYFIL